MIGLDTYEDGVGYKHIKIKPHIGGNFSYASATLQTNYGQLSSGWKVENDKILMDVEIPANTTATVYVPAPEANAITENGAAIGSSKEIQVTGKEEGYTVLQLGSGVYHFNITKAAESNAAVNLNEYIEMYKVAEGMISMIEVKMLNGKLMLVVRNNPTEMEAVKNARDQFITSEGSTTTFIRDEQGKVIRVKTDALGMTFEGVRQ